MTSRNDEWLCGVRGIVALRKAKGTKLKQNIIRDMSGNQWFMNYLYYLLNPMLTYKLSEKTLSSITCDEWNGVDLPSFCDLFTCCEYLSKLKGIDTSVIKQVRAMLSREVNTIVDGELTMRLYVELLSKKARLGITAHTVNKIVPNFIPEWNVQQSFPIDKYPLKDGSEFWATQKLNGVRATYYKGQLFARSGVPYTGLDDMLTELDVVSRGGTLVLDGELTLKDKCGLSDNESFRKATGILNSDEPHKDNICLTVFDAIPVEDFESDVPTVKYSERRAILDEIRTSNLNFIYTRILPVLYHGTDQSMIPSLLDKMVREDKEGLMINLNVPYFRKRHRGILKVKRFYTADLEITDVRCGDGKYKDVLGAFVVKFKDNEVSVGSGFSDEQRQYYWEHKDELIGKICEVKYKEISCDKKTGLESLQFPVFVGVRYDKDAPNVEEVHSEAVL